MDDNVEVTENLSIELVPQTPPVELSLQVGEIKQTEPRTLTFGSIRVTENIGEDLLSDQEREVYHRGMEVYQKLVDSSHDGLEKMVLLSPDIASNMVGMQPVISLDFGEAALLYQKFEETDTEGYVITNATPAHEGSNATGPHEGLYYMINIEATANILRANAEELKIQVPDRQMTEDEVLDLASSLFNGSDVSMSNLAFGLLSGFPLNDCRAAIAQGLFPESPPSISIVENPYEKFLEDKSRWLKRKKRLEVSHYIRMESYLGAKNKRQSFTPEGEEHHPDAWIDIQAYGVRWKAMNPLTPETIAQCQKLMQIDRELGLLDYVSKARSTYSVKDNMRRVLASKRILNF